MRTPLIAAIVVLACALMGAGCATQRYAQSPRHRVAVDSARMVTQDDVIRMSNAGVSNDVIIDLIGVTGSVYDLRPADVIALADSGVSDTVIRAMVRTAQQPPVERERLRPRYSWSGWWYGSPYLSVWYPWYGPAWYPWAPWYRWSPWYGGLSYGHRWGYHPLISRSYAPRSAGWAPRAGGVSGGSARGGGRAVGRHR